MNSLRFRKVAVLMGGPSAERDISLASGTAVAGALRDYGYDVLSVDVQAQSIELPDGVDVAFIALHGEFGEDGSIQRLLDEMGIPYTGSGPEASARSFCKLETKQCLESAGLPTPGYEVIDDPEGRTLPLPLIVKPLRQGSSIGLARVFDEAMWSSAFAEAHAYGERVLVEEFIPGRELTVGIVGSEVLPVLEIVAPDGYYDFAAKYTTGKTRYEVPARIAEEASSLCRDYARRAFDALGCSGFGRVDFRLSKAGVPYILEMNTIPGFTATSLLPKAAKVAGIDFPELCHRILEYSVL